MSVSAAGTFYGRTPEQWDNMVRVTSGYLQQRARGRGHTSYTDVNNYMKQRLGHGFDFDLPSERHALGYLLADVNERDDPSHHVMLSAIVSYIDDPRPGGDFFEMATTWGLLPPGASAAQREIFYWSQIEAVWDRYARRRQNRRQADTET